MQRVGVFVCWCGSNIAGTVDVQVVSEALKSEPGVVFSTNYQYMCSQAGQDMIIKAVKEHNLTGIVVCSCSPRMHEATFRKTAAAAAVLRKVASCILGEQEHTTIPVSLCSLTAFIIIS